MDDPLGETHLTQAGMNVLGPPQVRTQLLLAPVELGGMASPNRLSPLSSLSHRPTRSEVPLSSDFHQTSRSTYPPLSVFRSNLFKSLLSPTPYNSRTRSSLPSTHSVLLRTLYGSPFLSPVDTSESKRGGAHGIGGIVRRIEHLLAEHPAPHGRGLAPKRPYLDPLGLIEKHSPRTLSIGKFSSPDSSLRTTNNTGDDLDSKSGLCAAITPVLVDPCSPLSQPCCSLGSTLIKVETTSDTWIDREDMPNAQNLALSCPSSVTVVDYSGSQSVPDLSSLISNHPKELPSPASLESLALLLVSLPHMSSVKSKEDRSLGKTHRPAHDSLTQGYEVMLSIKATFLQGLSALAAMFPSISPSHRIKTPNIGHLCAPDYRLDVEPINSDGYCIRVKFKNPLSQHKPLDFVEYHFPAPKQTNIYDAHFQCGSLVAIDPVGYHHKLDKYSQFTIPGDEHKGALLMSPAEPKTIKVVDAPILVPCKIEAYPSVPLPTTVDDLQGQPATDKGEIGELGSGPLKQNKIFNLQDIVDRANHIQGHQSGSDQVMRKPANGDIREARHPDTLATAHPDVMNLPPPRQCRLERRWSNRRKRPKFNSCLAAPSYFCSSYRIHLSGQPIKSYSAGDGEPGGFGDLFDFSLYHSVFGGFPNDSGLTNGGEIWSGQGPGSELQQGLEMSDQLLYDPLDSTEPAPNILAPQPQYYDEGNLPVQEPFHVPSPPVPLPVNLQPNAHGSGWSAIEPAPNIAAPQVRSRDESGSATRPPSNTPLPINSQLDTRGPEWYDGFKAGVWVTRGLGGPVSWPQPCPPEWNNGFFVGCNFASNTSRGPPSGLRSQSNQTGHSIVEPLAPTTVAPNTNAQSSPTSANLDFPTAPSPTPRASQGLAVQSMGHLPQAQLGSSTTQIIVERDMQNGVQIGATPRGSASRANNEASTSSHIGPTRTSNRNTYMCDFQGCERGERGFSQKDRLSNHIQRYHHRQPNRYTCTFPDCGRSYTSQGILNRHRRIVHSNTKGKQKQS